MVKGKTKQAMKAWQKMYGKDGCMEFPTKGMTVYIRTEENPDRVHIRPDIVGLTKHEDNTVSLFSKHPEESYPYMHETFLNVISLESN